MAERHPTLALVDEERKEKLLKVTFETNEGSEGQISGFKFLQRIGKSGITQPQQRLIHLSGVTEGELESVLKMSEAYGLRFKSILDITNSL